MLWQIRVGKFQEILDVDRTSVLDLSLKIIIFYPFPQFLKTPLNCAEKGTLFWNFKQYCSLVLTVVICSNHFLIGESQGHEYGMGVTIALVYLFSMENTERLWNHFYSSSRVSAGRLRGTLWWCFLILKEIKGDSEMKLTFCVCEASCFIRGIIQWEC